MMITKKNRKVDFAKQYKEYDKENRSLKNSTVLLAILGAFLLIGIIYYSVNLFSENYRIKSEIKTIEAYIYDANNIEKVNEVYVKDDQIAELQLVSDDLDSVNTIVGLYPSFGKAMINQLKFDNITIDSMQYNVYNIVLDVSTTSLTAPTAYVNYLKDTGLFYQVKYYGFTNSTAEAVEYSFSVECTLARGTE